MNSCSSLLSHVHSIDHSRTLGDHRYTLPSPLFWLPPSFTSRKQAKTLILCHINNVEIKKWGFLRSQRTPDFNISFWSNGILPLSAICPSTDWNLSVLVFQTVRLSCPFYSPPNTKNRPKSNRSGIKIGSGWLPSLMSLICRYNSLKIGIKLKPVLYRHEGWW